MSSDPKSNYERGHASGSNSHSAADEGAEIIGRFLQSEEYVAGHEDGEDDRAENA